MKSKEVNKKNDIDLSNLLNNKYLYITILLVIIIYFFNDDRVLNLPKYFWLIRWVFASLLIGLLVFIRYLKFKKYYNRKFKDWLSLFFFFATFLLFTIFLQAAFEIPIDIFIKWSAKENPIELFECDIKNVITTKIDKVHFVFLGQKYSRYFDSHGHNRKELMSDFYLEVSARKSIFNTYYLESIEVKEKSNTAEHRKGESSHSIIGNWKIVGPQGVQTNTTVEFTNSQYIINDKNSNTSDTFNYSMLSNNLIGKNVRTGRVDTTIIQQYLMDSILVTSPNGVYSYMVKE